MKVLWLASWYPNKHEPYNGDFIQRHAKAVNEVLPIDVIHVVQLGKDAPGEDATEELYNGTLREIIYYFSFKKVGLGIIDKVRYNLKYLKVSKQAMEDYEQKYGRPDLIHVHVPIKAGIIAMKFSAKWKIPFIVSEQASYYEDAAPNNFFRRSFFFRSNAKKIFRSANAITNVSATIGEKMKRIFGVKQVIPVHNSVDTRQFFYNGFKRGSSFIWLHVSAMNEQKNIAGMLKAFAFLDKTITDWRLTVVGPAQYEHHQLAKDLGIFDKIDFIGEVSHADVASYMKKANAFVLFSRHENFPCVVVEALCSGLPVIASEVGGVKEAIQTENGRLVPSEDIEQLAHELHTLMLNYHHFDQRQIQSNAAAKYNTNLVARQFVQLYEKVISNSK